jgi:hypothetical protein
LRAGASLSSGRAAAMPFAAGSVHVCGLQPCGMMGGA